MTTSLLESFKAKGRPTLITCSDGKSIKIWDLKSKKCVKTLEGHKNDVICLGSFSDNQIISASRDY